MSREDWQLTGFQRSTYSVGMFSSSIVTATVMNWLLYYYSPPPDAIDEGMVFLGIGVAVGLARLFGSTVDALTNPLVAFWSDRSNNPAGRRVPFIIRGTIPLMIFAILIWFPPVRGASYWNIAWLTLTLSCTWFFYTYVVAPYLALMPELTSNSAERVSLTVQMAYWESGAIIIASLGVPPLLEALKDGWQLGPIFLADGFKVSAILLAIIGGIGFFISVSMIKEKKLTERQRTTLSLKQSIVECFRNPSFPPYLLAVSSAKIAIGLVMISLPFFVKSVLNKGEGFLTILLAPMFLSMLVGFILAKELVNRIGLKKAFRFSTFISIFIVFTFFLVYFLGGSAKKPVYLKRTPAGDIEIFFSNNSEIPKITESELSLLPRYSVSDANIFVRLTSLEIEQWFREMDIDSFRRTVAEMSPEDAAALLRSDTGMDANMTPETKKQWLLEQEPGALVLHLKPEAGKFLFKKQKSLTDSSLSLSSLTLKENFSLKKPVSLSVEIGRLEEPETTFNIEGWTMILSTVKERKAMAPPQRHRTGKTERFDFTGELLFVDGSAGLKNFTPAAMNQYPTGLDKTRLNNLLGRFEMQTEFDWSIRIYLTILICFLIGFPAAVLMSMYRPLVCEIADLDEKRTGKRREAMYFGVEGLLTKLADGISALIAPAIMVIGHLFVAPPFGYVLPFLAGSIFMLLAFLVFKRYPLGGPPK